MLYYWLHITQTFTVYLITVQTNFQAHWHSGFGGWRGGGGGMSVVRFVVVCLGHVLFYLHCIRTTYFFEVHLKFTLLM